MVGPAILFIIAVFIARDGGGWFTPKDIAFLTVLGCLILGRIVEFSGGDPRTAAGEPATRDHLRRYIIVALAIGLAAWTLANLVGNHQT